MDATTTSFEDVAAETAFEDGTFAMPFITLASPSAPVLLAVPSSAMIIQGKELAA